MQVRPVETANETFGESCPWGFILGRKRQKRGKCGESFPRQRAQVQTDGGIWVRGKYIFEMTCRHSVNQCFVPWMKTLFGVLENRFQSFVHSKALSRVSPVRAARWPSTSGATTRSSIAAQRACESESIKTNQHKFNILWISGPHSQVARTSRRSSWKAKEHPT